MNARLLCFFLPLVAVGACGTPPLVFQPDPLVMAGQGVELRARLTGDAGPGAVTLSLAVSNGSREILDVDCERAELVGADGLMTYPDKVSDGKYVLLPGKQAALSVRFLPVGKAALYQQVKERGPLTNEYSVRFDFIKVREGNQVFITNGTFRLPDAAYSAYRARHVRADSAVPYELRVDNDALGRIQAHMAAQLAARKRADHDGHDHGKEADEIRQTPAMVSGNELIARDVILKLGPYRVKDELFLYVKFINKGSQYMYIDFDKLVFEVGGKRFAPVGGNSDARRQLPMLKWQDKEQCFLVSGNERAECTIRYGNVPAVTALLLDPAGLKIGKLPFLPEALRFERKP